MSNRRHADACLMCRGSGSITFDPRSPGRPEPCWDCGGRGRYPAPARDRDHADGWYAGVRMPGDAGCVAMDRAGRTLRPRLDVCNHSPTGFEWGYAGSGPSQLALAVLADYFGPAADAARRAAGLHQTFSLRVVCMIPPDAGWRLADAAVDDFLARLSDPGTDWGRWWAGLARRGLFDATAAAAESQPPGRPGKPVYPSGARDDRPSGG